MVLDAVLYIACIYLGCLLTDVSAWLFAGIVWLLVVD